MTPRSNALIRTAMGAFDFAAAFPVGGDNQTDHAGSYSFAWWTNGLDRDGKRRWPDAPPDTYGAFGHAGMRALVVIPSLDLVATWNDARIENPAMENRALRMLVESVGRTK